MRLLGAGRHLRLVARDGWEYVERPGVTGIVLVVAVTDGGRLVLVEQERPPVRARVVELPAGLVGDVPGAEDEELAEAARRELLEETGYEARELELVLDGPPSPGLTSEVVSFYLATGLRRAGPGGGAGEERIEVHEVPLAEAERWLAARRAAGRLVDPKCYVALWMIGAAGPRLQPAAPGRRRG